MKLRMPLFIIAIVVIAVLAVITQAHADDNAYFKYGPLSLNVPLKTVQVVYMYDFRATQNLVGGETPILTLWDRLEGDFGAVTSLEGAGTPFVGGNLLIGNLLDKWVTLPADLKVGGFGGYNFNTDHPIYGLKASYKLW